MQKRPLPQVQSRTFKLNRPEMTNSSPPESIPEISVHYLSSVPTVVPRKVHNPKSRMSVLDSTQHFLPLLEQNTPQIRPGGGRRSLLLPQTSAAVLPEPAKAPSRLMLVSRQGRKQQYDSIAASRFRLQEMVEARNALVSEKVKTMHDRKMIIDALGKHFIFAELPDEQLQLCIDAMKFYRLAGREVVFNQGERATQFFIAISGRLEVVVNGKQVKVLSECDSFGELALLHDTPRSASVLTLEPCSMWALDRQTFRESITAISSLSYAENKTFIFGISSFAVLTSAQKESLVHALVTHAFPSGHRIVNEGDPGDLLYIVKEGSVVCYQKGVEVRRMGKGEFFGEQTMLYGGFRSATVIADGPVKCVSFGTTDLVQVLGNQLHEIIYLNTQRIALEKSHHLSRLTREQIAKVIAAMKIKTYLPGQIVIKKGADRGAFLWVVLQGALCDSGNDVVAEQTRCYGDKDFEQAPDGIYESDITAQGREVHIAEISRAAFESCIGGSLPKATVNNEALAVLKRVQLLRGLAPERMKLLLSCLEVREYPPGATIVQQHNPGDCFFIVRSGQVKILKDSVPIRVMSKLDYFGERAVLFDDFRSATAVAMGDVSCWVLEKHDFLRVLTDTMRLRLEQRIQMQDDSVTLERLILVKTIGKGMFGNVFLAADKEKGTLYALKTVSRDKVDAYNLHESLLLEKEVMLLLDNLFVVKLVKTFKDAHRLYFLMEYVKGVDLFDGLRKMSLLNDDDARFYIGGMILMLEHLHERGVLYRDLKPENIMIDEEGYPRLIDFGTAKIVTTRTYSVIGTPHYMAPEVILGKGYNHTIDYYSLGILLYECLFGKVPFGDEEDDPYKIYQHVLEHRLSYPKFADPHFAAKALIEQLLSSNPAMRTGGDVDRLKAHRWFNGFEWVIATQDKLLSKELRPPFIPNVNNINREIAIAMVKRSSIESIEVRTTQEEEEETDDDRSRQKHIKPDGWDAKF